MQKIQKLFLLLGLGNVIVTVYLLSVTKTECHQIDIGCPPGAVCYGPPEACNFVTNSGLFMSFLVLLTLIFVYFIVRAYNLRST